MSIDSEKINDIKEYESLKLNLKKYEGKYSFYYVVFAILTVISIDGAFFFIMINSLERSMLLNSLIATAIFALIVGIIVLMYFCMYLENKKTRLRTKMLDYELKNAREEVKEDIFKNSIEMSYKYLDQYYEQTKDHAQKGFIITLFVSVSGAILIFIGIIAMFLEKAQPSYITCASGVITEFIAAVFFYLYNKTVSSMGNYHDKLVLSHNISIALKVSESLASEDKAKAKNAIINELLKDINLHLVKDESSEKKKSQKKESKKQGENV